jgi:hypothetical protein
MSERLLTVLVINATVSSEAFSPEKTLTGCPIEVIRFLMMSVCDFLAASVARERCGPIGLLPQ